MLGAGGTPSLLSPAMLEQILSSLGNVHNLASTCEVTVEMDPGTFDVAKARAFKQLGVNRTSVGIQTFNGAVLKSLGRSHTLHDVEQALEALLEAGITSNSVDLMSGLPGQTVAMLAESVHRAMAWEHVTHISVYDLILEQGTKFAQMYSSGDDDTEGNPRHQALPNDDTAADMMECFHSLLVGKYGMEHYEVSNFARDSSHICRHNLNYWDGQRGWLGASTHVDLVFCGHMVAIPTRYY